MTNYMDVLWCMDKKEIEQQMSDMNNTMSNIKLLFIKRWYKFPCKWNSKAVMNYIH